jgi:hypothetical protein
MAVIWLCVFGLAPARASIVPYVSDEQLVLRRIIVVAKWNKAPVVPNRFGLRLYFPRASPTCFRRTHWR